MGTTKLDSNSTLVPVHLCGDLAEQQQLALREILQNAAEEAFVRCLQILDYQNAKFVLEAAQEMKRHMIDGMLEEISRHTGAERYQNEDGVSTRIYPKAYFPRPLEAQVTELRSIFPQLQTCNEKIARLPLPDGAEAWFAIPRWQCLAPSYQEALRIALAALAKRRRFTNLLGEQLSPQQLRQTSRTELAERVLAEQQPDCDIQVVAAQFGMRYRGSSARRARVSMAVNEYGLSTFANIAMILTHPERLSTIKTLMIDCSGDETSYQASGNYDRVPLLDLDACGIELSMFYEDRFVDRWSTPSGFLWKSV